MKRFMIVGLFLIFIPHGIVSALDFSGTFGSTVDGEDVTLRLSQNVDGKVTGTMSLEGAVYTIEGVRQGNRVDGSMTAFGESIPFSAQFTEKDLLLTLSVPEDDQGDSEDLSETLIFQRLKNGSDAGPSETMTHTKSRSVEGDRKGDVVINGVVLTDNQLEEFEMTYKSKPPSGRYWYDTRSGLFGVLGFPAYGFMLPGHRYGKLESNVSNGNTGVFVNGRELPEPEWAIWSQLLGYIIQPGRYWLDADGNAGYEGNPIPTENLYIAAQRNAYQSAGGGGDNFWSSRFSAGNYDSGNQRGYVSVPGYGPVGYGF